MTWPFENDTSAVIRKLSNARLRQHHFRNRLIGVIIFMAAAIMAFVSSYAYNVTSEYAASTAYQGIFLNLSQENISRLTADPRIESVGVYQSVGMTERENGITMGIVCSDEATMRLSNIKLIEGHMPQAADELLVERGYIDALNLKAGIGDIISVHYRNQASRQLETVDLQITGFIQTTAENDSNRVAYNAIVSQSFLRETSTLSAGSLAAMISVCDTEKYANQELKELIRTIGLDCGISTDNIQINNLYIDSNNMSKETVLTVLLVGLVLIGVCSLVIYNIFFISVMNNVTSFGQLRTLGATKKQIRRIISKEGNYLALRFIPLGCIVGGALSFLIDRDAFQLVPDVVIVILAGAIVFICVKLSVLNPAKIAMSVSPMEAFRYSSYTEVKKRGKRLKKNRKPLTPLSLAAMNLLRDGKKSILTFTSLVLSGMMLVGISSLLSSLDPEQRAKRSFPYDGSYVVELNRALVTPTFSLTRLQENNLLTDELKHEILSIDGVSEVFCQQEICTSTDGMATVIMSMNTADYEKSGRFVMDGALPKPDDIGEQSLVVNMGSAELAYLQKSYEVGDTITFLPPGTGLQNSFSYTVSAVIFDENSAVTFILPEAEMKRAVSYNANSAFVIRAKADGSPELESELRSLISSSDTLRIKTLRDMTMLYQSLFSAISAAAYALLAVIIMFSVINLINTSMTNIISRRKEMGLFRAIGLDSKQLSHMIGFENGFQTLGSFAASVAGGLAVGKAIRSAVGNVPGFSFIGYTFPIVSVCFYFLLALALQFILTKWASLYCRQNSVVEQLRVTE